MKCFASILSLIGAVAATPQFIADTPEVHEAKIAFSKAFNNAARVSSNGLEQASIQDIPPNNPIPSTPAVPYGHHVDIQAEPIYNEQPTYYNYQDTFNVPGTPSLAPFNFNPYSQFNGFYSPQQMAFNPQQAFVPHSHQSLAFDPHQSLAYNPQQLAFNPHQQHQLAFDPHLVFPEQNRNAATGLPNTFNVPPQNAALVPLNFNPYNNHFSEIYFPRHLPLNPQHPFTTPSLTYNPQQFLPYFEHNHAAPPAACLNWKGDSVPCALQP